MPAQPSAPVGSCSLGKWSLRLQKAKSWARILPSSETGPLLSHLEREIKSVFLRQSHLPLVGTACGWPCLVQESPRKCLLPWKMCPGTHFGLLSLENKLPIYPSFGGLLHKLCSEAGWSPSPRGISLRQKSSHAGHGLQAQQT